MGYMPTDHGRIPREGDFGCCIDYLPRINRRKANRLG
jgi:hypothetical protein